MRVAGLAGVVAVAGQMAAAQSWVDYDLLLQENADRVVTTTGAHGQVTRMLDLGDGISVTCDDAGCVGTDVNGAAGCAFSIVTQLHAAAVACPTLFEEETVDALSRLYDLAGGHVAASAVPVQDWAARGEDILATARAGYDQGICLSLIAQGPESEIRQMAGAMITPDGIDALTEFFAQRRLPVMNPCL